MHDSMTENALSSSDEHEICVFIVTIFVCQDRSLKWRTRGTMHTNHINIFIKKHIRISYKTYCNLLYLSYVVPFRFI